MKDRVETTPSPSDSLPPLPSADALSADDHRLLAMLRGEWNNEADGYWPAVDAMDEAARVIERLAARLAEAQKDSALLRKLREVWPAHMEDFEQHIAANDAAMREGNDLGKFTYHLYRKWWYSYTAWLHRNCHDY